MWLCARDDLETVTPLCVTTSRTLDETGAESTLAHQGASGGVPRGRYGQQDVGGICHRVVKSQRANNRDATPPILPEGRYAREVRGSKRPADSLRSTTLPISSVMTRRAYRQIHLKKSAITSTTFFPAGNGGNHGSGTPERSDSGERRSLNHSHLTNPSRTVVFFASSPHETILASSEGSCCS